jgi:hypothetical protein
VTRGSESERTGRQVAGLLPVTFYLAGEPDLERFTRLDPDADHDEFRPGEHSWVAQTFLRLRDAGYPVALSEKLPASGLVVFHAKHKHALARAARGRPGLVFVAIRADNSSPLLADFEVVQSGYFADGRKRFFITFWPQPGLRPRDPSRGTTLERVVYMGRIENLHPEFRDESWGRALAGMGIEWVFREVRFERSPAGPKVDVRDRAAPIDWEDYSQLDAVLAVRPFDRHLRYSKPASKLINAWRARLPALLGPEYAFQEIRRSDEDYFEVADAPSALETLRRLRSDPELYRRMVANGVARAPEFSFGALTRRWAELLFETLPQRLAVGGLPWSHRLPLPMRLPVRRCLRLLRAQRAR